ncbi:MAG: TrmH family RNA methyltransferase [Bacteroidetes bacterium]|nr:TrmH family RNA methyltransferase [Bacteroidota bacterium]
MMRKLTMEELNRPDAAASAGLSRLPLRLVVDNVRSMHNVGAFFRTADALAIEGLVLCGITAQPPHREIHKSALGAEDTVHWEYLPDVADALRHLRSQGYYIALLEQTDAGIPLPDFSLPLNRPLALVVGNEVSGVSDAALALADVALEIPQYGTKHSLNVSVAAGIAMWQLCQQWRQR